jgi:soluble lytic murein transglycosylase-like protein
MQLMPRTAASLNVTDAFNPRQNIFGGTKFLRILIDRYDGDINLILAAYNAGDVAVRRYDGIPYAKTRQYVASVYHWYQVYASQESE